MAAGLRTGGPGYLTFLVEGGSGRGRVSTDKSYLARLGRGPRWTVMGPPLAMGAMVPKGRQGKRKRVLYRRFLVSLEARRRIPTRPSLRRRRETPHDEVSCGSSSKFSPSKLQYSLRRTNFF